MPREVGFVSYERHPDSVPVALHIDAARRKHTVYVNSKPDSGGRRVTFADRPRHGSVRAPPQQRLDIGDDGELYVLTPKHERAAVFVSGRAGAGKSTWTRNWLAGWREDHPDNDLHLFSLKDSDESIDDLEPARIDLEALPELVADPEAFKVKTMFAAGDAVVFDDVDGHPNKRVQAAVDAVRNAVLQLGRDHQLYVAVTNHLGPSGAQTKAAIKEATGYVAYPDYTPAPDYFLKTYVQLTKPQIADFKRTDSRWVYYGTNAPQIMIGENFIQLMRGERG